MVTIEEKIHLITKDIRDLVKLPEDIADKILFRQYNYPFDNLLQTLDFLIRRGDDEGTFPAIEGATNNLYYFLSSGLLDTEYTRKWAPTCLQQDYMMPKVLCDSYYTQCMLPFQSYVDMQSSEKIVYVMSLLVVALETLSKIRKKIEEEEYAASTACNADKEPYPVQERPAGSMLELRLTIPSGEAHTAKDQHITVFCDSAEAVKRLNGLRPWYKDLSYSWSIEARTIAIELEGDEDSLLTAGHSILERLTEEGVYSSNYVIDEGMKNNEFLLAEGDSYEPNDISALRIAYVYWEEAKLSLPPAQEYTSTLTIDSLSYFIGDMGQLMSDIISRDPNIGRRILATHAERCQEESS
jgi:hypothetical protein